MFAHIWTKWGKRAAYADSLIRSAAIDKRSHIVILGYKPHNTTMTIIVIQGSCLVGALWGEKYIFISLAELSSWKWVLSHSLQCLCCICFGISLCIELLSLPGSGLSARVSSLFLTRGGEDTQNWASYLSSLTLLVLGCCDWSKDAFCLLPYSLFSVASGWLQAHAMIITSLKNKTIYPKNSSELTSDHGVEGRQKWRYFHFT